MNNHNVVLSSVLNWYLADSDMSFVLPGTVIIIGRFVILVWQYQFISSCTGRTRGRMFPLCLHRSRQSRHHQLRRKYFVRMFQVRTRLAPLSPRCQAPELHHPARRGRRDPLPDAETGAASASARSNLGSE